MPVPKTTSPITQLERMIEKSRSSDAAIKSVESAPDDWLRKLPSTAEVRNGANGQKAHGNGA